MPWPDLFARREEDASAVPPPPPESRPNPRPQSPQPRPATSSSPTTPPFHAQPQHPEPPQSLSSSTTPTTPLPLLHSPLKTAILASILGLTFGSTSALFRRSPTPTLFALATSIQWGALGGTYAFVRGRGMLMAEERGRHLHLEDVRAMQAAKSKEGVALAFPAEPAYEVSAREKARISGIAGAAAGAVGGAIRGRVVNVIAGAGVFGVLGWIGQVVVDARRPGPHAHQHGVDAAGTSLQTTEQTAGEAGKESTGMIERMAKSKWNPMRKLTDEEYEGMLREKLIRVEAEIAVVDEEIAALEAQGSRARDEEMCAEREG